ncbi:MAG: hypothetical protein K2M31_00040 [Muribaculaceae bacterium]|nr:hypothetical protein [Muribaculaceae bacterium]
MSRLFRHIDFLNQNQLILTRLASICGLACIMGLGGFIGGCAGHSSSERSLSDSDSIPSDAIVVVGDSALTRREVEIRIPAGTSPEDSIALFHSIVDGWIERLLLTEIAARNIEDMDEIDRLVEDYRKKLIIARYRRSLRESRADGVSGDDIERYFKANAEEMILDAPVIKGLYVKIPSDASRLADIRRWIMTATPDAIDNLEKYGLNDAIEYSFFEDRWTDWNSISRQIPYNFGNPDDFVGRRKNLETSYRGFTYLLHISSFLPSGEKMPREIAEPFIRERLSTENGDRYESRLISGIYNEAIKSGRLRLINYEHPSFESSSP